MPGPLRALDLICLQRITNLKQEAIMKRIAIIIFLSIFSSALLNAQEVSMQNGMYVTAGGELFSGKFTEHFLNGAKKAELTILKGKAEGLAVYYFENGTKMETGNFLAGLRNGTWEKWSEKGVKIGEANYKAGIKDGLWLVWDEQGTKRMEMHYSAGEKTGKWLMWNENGVLNGERIYTEAQ
jgi:antitoxin component YwqK of YwqJK toxin-antitoxin module